MAKWGTDGDRAGRNDGGFARLVETLAVDQARYRSWAAIVGGVAIAVGIGGALVA